MRSDARKRLAETKGTEPMAKSGWCIDRVHTRCSYGPCTCDCHAAHDRAALVPSPTPPSTESH